jgi:hypothetical protein
MRWLSTYAVLAAYAVAETYDTRKESAHVLASPEAQDEDVPVAALVSKLHLGKADCTAAAAQAGVVVRRNQGECNTSA